MLWYVGRIFWYIYSCFIFMMVQMPWYEPYEGCLFYRHVVVWSKWSMVHGNYCVGYSPRFMCIWCRIVKGMFSFIFAVWSLEYIGSFWETDKIIWSYTTWWLKVSMSVCRISRCIQEFMEEYQRDKDHKYIFSCCTWHVECFMDVFVEFARKWFNGLCKLSPRVDITYYIV